MPISKNLFVTHLLKVGIDVFNHDLCDVDGAYRMFEARMDSPGEDHLCEAELPHSSETLKRRVINNCNLFSIKVHVTVDRQKEFLHPLSFDLGGNASG